MGTKFELLLPLPVCLWLLLCSPTYSQIHNLFFLNYNSFLSANLYIHLGNLSLSTVCRVHLMLLAHLCV